MIRRLAWLCLCLPVLALAAPGTREQARLETLREQRATLEHNLKRTESERADASDRLRDIEQSIAASTRNLRALAAEQGLVRAELAAHERDRRRVAGQIARGQAQLARLLRHQVKTRQADALATLFEGGDPGDAARDRYFLTLLSRSQAELIAGLRRDSEESRRLADVVRQRSVALAELTRREAAETAELRRQQTQRQALLAEMSEQIRRQRLKIAALRQDEQRLGNVIAALARQRAQSRATKPPRSGPAEQAVAPRPARPSTPPPTGAVARLRGRLVMPVHGVLSGRYGARRDEGQTVWKGWFIKASEGTEVRAVADGVVVFADWLRGYGNLVIVDHDDEVLSVYGNNQTLLAQVGQQVGAGKAIATVGAGEGRDESGLYFELRHRGHPFDPGKWFGAP